MRGGLNNRILLSFLVFTSLSFLFASTPKHLPSTIGLSCALALGKIESSESPTDTTLEDASTNMDAKYRKHLETALSTWPDATQVKNRMWLLENREIIGYKAGGMGITFVLRNPKTGAVHRYKAPLIFPENPEKTERNQKFFLAEWPKSQLAGRHKVSPPAIFDPGTGLLKMKEIRGKNLQEFSGSDLKAMRRNHPEEWEKWLEDFAVQTIDALINLHQLGIAHLDLKPANIMVGENGEIYLIDFGLSLFNSELAQKHKEMQEKNTVFGTLRYFGPLMESQRPDHGEDFYAFGILFRELLSAQPEEWSRQSFLKDRKYLRAMMALWQEPVPNEHALETSSQDLTKIFKIAIKKEQTPEEKKLFYNYFKTHLRKRSPGQQLRILFSDKLFEKSLFRDTSDQLKSLMNAGFIENDWKYDSQRNQVQAQDQRSRLLRYLKDEPDSEKHFPRPLNTPLLEHLMKRFFGSKR